MKINLRQEIAMWVLGLLWTGLALASLHNETSLGDMLGPLISLVPACLIVFSLRDCKNPNWATTLIGSHFPFLRSHAIFADSGGVPCLLIK